MEPNTDYTFSAWVKGSYLSAGNSGHASIGVVDPTTGKFMIYSKYNRKSSRSNRQIYPTAWDEEWHLRSVAFNSGDLTEVTIALCGDNSKLWVDGIALYKNGQGVKYMGARNAGYARPDYGAYYVTCKESDSLLTNSSFSSGDTFWKTGNGWKNGFLSVINDNSSYGKVLRYKEGDGYGTYYIKWVEVKPNTDYSFYFDIKVKQSGGGGLVILDDCMSKPNQIANFVFDTMLYGTDWDRYYIQFNSSNFTRIGIAVCNMGGEALMDNIRLFESSKGFKDTSGETVGTIATQKTTKKPTDSIPTVVGGGQNTTTAGGETTTTAEGETTTVIEGETTTVEGVTDATRPPEADAPAADADTAPDKEPKFDFTWTVVGIAGGIVLLVGGGGVALFLLLRRKKMTPPTE